MSCETDFHYAHKTLKKFLLKCCFSETGSLYVCKIFSHYVRKILLHCVRKILSHYVSKILKCRVLDTGSHYVPKILKYQKKTGIVLILSQVSEENNLQYIQYVWLAVICFFVRLYMCLVVYKIYHNHWYKDFGFY